MASLSAYSLRVPGWAPIDQGLELAGLVVAVEQGAVQAVAGHGGPHAARMVGLPADDVAGVLRHQLRRARVHIHAVHVEDLGIAPVVADQHMVGVVFQVVLDAGAHAVPGRQVGGFAAARVDRQHVEVLVAAEVLLVEHHVRALPEEVADVALGLGRDAAWLAHRGAALQRLHMDVHARRMAVHADGLHEAQRLSIIGQAEEAALRIAEEVLDRSRWRWAGARSTPRPTTRARCAAT